MEHGSLHACLRQEGDAIVQSEKIRLAIEIASGLEYLASRGFVHRDVAARNILVNSEFKAKISDFGMSRDASDSNNYYRSSGGNVPVYAMLISVISTTCTRMSVTVSLCS